MNKLIYILMALVLANVSLMADIIHVPADVETIQEGINEAEKLDTVLVAEGTYYENINFDGKPITVASWYLLEENLSIISNTIIDGSEPLHEDNASVVSFVSGEDTKSTIHGFTIRGGSGTLVGDEKYRIGGGILCFNSGATISYNKIEYNSIKAKVPSFGAGIGHGPTADASSLVIEHNWIEHNTIEGDAFCAGGGIDICGNGTISENFIRYNKIESPQDACKGGGISARGTPDKSVEITNNDIILNHVISVSEQNQDMIGGGGLWISEYSNSLISGNRFQNNKVRSDFENFGAGIMIYRMNSSNKFCSNHVVLNYCSNMGKGGGVCIWKSNICVFNNIISHNRSMYGGGMYLFGKYNRFQEGMGLRVVNNTLVCNTAFSEGGGLYIWGSDPVVFNSIIWDNSAKEDPGIHIVQGRLDKTFVAYSNVQNLKLDSNGNINEEPLFANQEFQLSNTSPCIGAGIDELVLAGRHFCCPSCCIMGNPRPFPKGSKPDMGACEHKLGGEITMFNYTNCTLPLEYTLKQNYPNPFNPTTTIEFSIQNSEYVVLKIYNSIGQEMATLVSENLAAGSYTTTWNASDFASGIYYYKIETGNYKAIKKLILMK